MKCDELTPIELECNMGKDINGVVHREPWKAYDIDEVDAAIAELKDKLQLDEDEMAGFLQLEEECGGGDLRNYIAELKAENKMLKEHIANGDVSRITWIDEAMELKAENRRLQRALWISRANRAIEKIAWFKLWNASISTMNPEDGARQEFDKWKKNLGKFLKKAEEYK